MVGTQQRAGAAAAVVAVLLSATPVSTFAPGLALPGVAGPSCRIPMRAQSVCGALRMDAGMQKGKGLLSAAAGAAMAVSIVFGPVAPLEQAVAFSDVPDAPAVLGEEGAIHLARRSWLEENESLEELVKGGLSGKDAEEGPIAARKVVTSFLSMEHEEKGERKTIYSTVLTKPSSLQRSTPTMHAWCPLLLLHFF
jgi:hypothetical protein